MGSRLFLPDVPWPTPQPETGGVAPRPALKRAAVNSDPGQQQTFRFTPVGESVRIILGEMRVGAKVPYALVYGGYLYVPLLWCWDSAACEGLQSIVMNEAAVPAGVSFVHYDGGAGNVVDPWLAAAWADRGETYTDTLPGWCYSVAKIPGSLVGTGGMPAFVAIVRGVKAYDPRTTNTVWTDNATLLTARFVGDADWGMGETVDYTTVGTPADSNDELVGGEKRRRLNLAIEGDNAVGDMLEALRTYAGVFVLRGENGAAFVADRPLASLTSVGDGSAYPLRTISETTKRSRVGAPTLIRVWYTDKTTTPWRRWYAEAQHPLLATAGVPYRASDVRLWGIPAYSQALREATERLNKLNLQDLTVDFGLFDEGLDITPGAGVSLTSAIAGLTAKQLRVFTRRHGNDLGDYDFVGAEYDPAAYSDAVGTGPTFADTALASPNDPQRPTGLVLTEELFTTQEDKTSSRIKASWTAPSDYPWVNHYRVNVRVGGEVLWTDTVRPGDVFRSGIVAKDVTYQVDVLTISSNGTPSAALSDNITAQGKLLPPGDVPTFTGFEAGGIVFLTLGGVVDIDQTGLEVRYGASAVAWSAAKFVDFANAASGVGAVIRSDIIPEGTWDFLACARDSGGRYSTNPKRITITVTLDAAAFLVDSHTFTTPTLTLMTAVQLVRNGAVHWITDAGDVLGFGHADTNDATGSFNDLAGVPFSSPRTAGTAIWLSESWDVGLTLSGNWGVTEDVTDYSGTHVTTLQLSTNGTDWTDYVGLSHKATARFARVKIESTGVMQINSAPSVRIDAVPRTETGTVTTSATGAVTVTLDGSYVFAKAIKLTAKAGAGGALRTPNYDNVVMNPTGTSSFDVVCNDSGNNLVANEVSWEFNGV